MVILLIYKEEVDCDVERYFHKRKEKKGLVIEDRRPTGCKMKGLKGESLTLNPSLL